MEQMTGDTTPITRLGSSFKNLGYAQIVMMIASFFISVVLGVRMIRIAIQSGSLEEFILDFKDTLRTFLIMLLLVSLIGIYFFYRLYQSLKSIEPGTEFASPLIDRVAKLFAAVIFLQIIGIIVGLYFINLIIQDLEELASNNPTPEGFEAFANKLSTSGEVIVTKIMAIVISLMMLSGFKSIQDWTIELQHSTRIFWFSEAGNKLGNVKIGIMILIGGQVFNLITMGGFGDLIEFVGVVVLIVSYIQVGNRLKNIPYNINVRGAMPQYPSSPPYPSYPSYDTTPQLAKQPSEYTQPSSVEIYCTSCGYSNHRGSQFCYSCGTKLT